MVWQKLRTWEYTCKDGTKGNEPPRIAIEDPSSNVQHQGTGCTQQPQHRVPADHTLLPRNTLTSQHWALLPCWLPPALHCTVTTIEQTKKSFAIHLQKLVLQL